jgi:hypothetical protein
MIVKTPLKDPTTVMDRSRMSRMKATDPVAKKIVARRRRLWAGCKLIERRPAPRGFGAGLVISVLH